MRTRMVWRTKKCFAATRSHPANRSVQTVGHKVKCVEDEFKAGKQDETLRPSATGKT